MLPIFILFTLFRYSHQTLPKVALVVDQDGYPELQAMTLHWGKSLDLSFIPASCSDERSNILVTHSLCQQILESGVSLLVSSPCVKVRRIVEQFGSSFGIAHLALGDTGVLVSESNGLILPEVDLSAVIELLRLQYPSKSLAVVHTASYASFIPQIENQLQSRLSRFLAIEVTSGAECITREISAELTQSNAAIVLFLLDGTGDLTAYQELASSTRENAIHILLSREANLQILRGSVVESDHLLVLARGISEAHLTTEGFIQQSVLSKTWGGMENRNLSNHISSIFYGIQNRLNHELFPPVLGSCSSVLEHKPLSTNQISALRSLVPVEDSDLRLMRGLKYERGGVKGARWQQVGVFNSSAGQWTLSLGEESLAEQSLDGKTLQIVTIVEEPFIIPVKDAAGRVTYEGYCIDVLRAIQKQVAQQTGHSFSYEMYEVADNQYGVFDERRQRWTGLIGDILAGNASIAVAGMIRNYDRERVVDFLASHMDYGVGILIKKPQKENNLFSFLEPLAPRVWTSICICGFVTGLTVYLLSRISPYSSYNQTANQCFNFTNSIWFVICSFLQQGGDLQPLAISSRILTSFWYFFALIIVTTYTANLAAFLTVTRMDNQVQSLADLARQTEIQYGTVAKSSLQEFFKDHAHVDATYEKIWEGISGGSVGYVVESVEKGYEMVKRGNYAFMWDAPVLEYHRKKDCDLVTVGKPFNKKNYAFAVPKGVAFGSTLSLAILSMQESGELEKLRQKWFESESICPEEETYDENMAVGLEMKNMAGVFLVLIIGFAISIGVVLLELVWYQLTPHKRRISKKVRAEISSKVKRSTGKTGYISDDTVTNSYV